MKKRAAAPRPPRPARAAAWWPLAVIVAVALALRLWHAHVVDGLWFSDHLGLDAKFYDEAARRIAGGDLFGGPVFFFGPLYSYFVALWYALFGPHLAVVRFVQAVLGAAGCLVVYELGRRCYSRRAGLLAAALCAVHAPLILYQGTLLYDQLAALLVPLVVLAFLRAVERGRRRDLLIAGALLGLTALGRANVLLFLPLALLAFWKREAFVEPDAEAGSQPDVRNPWTAWILAVAACVVVILPATVRNLAADGEFVPITANAGINFYIGNGPEATGGYVMPEGVDVREDALGSDYAAAQAGHPLKPGETSRWWWRRALAWDRRHPGRFVSLLLRKAALFWGAYDLPQIEHPGVMRTYSPALRVPHLPFGLLAPLGLVGLAFTWRRRRARLVGLFVLAYFLSVIPFFVVGRYRLPIHPLLMVTTAGGLWWLVDRLRARNWRPVAGYAVVLAALLLLCGWNRHDPNAAQQLAEVRFRLGSVAELKGLDAEARRQYELALAADPCEAQARLNLGLLMARSGDRGGAERELRRSLECDPTYARAAFNLGVLCARTGRVDEALSLLERATVLDPGYLQAWQAKARLSAALGRLDAAREAFRRVLELASSGRGEDAEAARRAREALQRLAGRPEGESVPDL